MKNRKHQLAKRAFHRAEKWRNQPPYNAAVQGILEGYRMAMSDMRKIVAECYKDAAEISQDPSRRIAHRNHCVRVRLQRFLRPLR